MARPERMELLEQVDLDKVASINLKAWEDAKIAQANIRKCGVDRRTGEPALYRLGTRDKQKIFLDFAMNVSQSHESRMGLTQWMLENPGEFAKLIVSMTPKEVSISGEVLHGIMVVPAREKNIAGWMERMEEKKEAAVPFVLDDVNWKTTPHEIDVEAEDEG